MGGTEGRAFRPHPPEAHHPIVEKMMAVLKKDRIKSITMQAIKM